MEHHYITVNNIRLHYVAEGSGKLLILLHGFPEFWYAWRHQIPALSPYFKVVAPDMRGYNLSDKPRGVAQYTIDQLAADVKELITALGEKSAFIVGHDWGGAVAWAVAHYYPNMVEKLAILNMPHPAEMRKHLLQFNRAQWKKSWYILYFQLPYLPEKSISRNLTLFFERALRGWAMRKEAFTDQDIAKYVAAFAQPQTLTATINYYRAAIRYIQRFRFEGILSMPVLMLWGENDKALGKELTIDTPQHCERLSLRYVPQCSHWIQHDYPELVNGYLLNFFQK